MGMRENDSQAKIDLFLRLGLVAHLCKKWMKNGVGFNNGIENHYVKPSLYWDIDYNPYLISF